ncbi:MAG: integrase [Deltaproteobacteria bacterium]|nr:MAG: integrase [Deltaproteobacteria bacterium]
MTNNTHENDAAKGAQLKVAPIKLVKDIKAIKELLHDNPRNLAIFTIGINTHLRPSELVHLTVSQVKDLQPKDVLFLEDETTGRKRKIVFNKSCVEAIQDLLISDNFEPDDLLFKSQRGQFVVPSISRLVKKWCEAINLRGNYGSHTLRKTWGYHQYRTFNTDIGVLMECFNHSSPRQTLEYLCIEDTASDADWFDNEL